MKDFFKLIKALKSFQKDVLLSIIFNILYSIFTVVSIPILIPFFQLLFNRSNEANVTENRWLDNILSYYTDYIDSHGKEHTLFMLCMCIVGLFFLKNASRYFASYFASNFRTGVVYNLREKLFHKYLHLPYSNYLNFKVGDAITRLTVDIQQIETSILKVLDVVFKAPIIIFGSVYIMIQISPQLSLFVVVLIFVTIIILGGISKSLKSASSDAQERVSNMSSMVEESISGIRTIKAYVIEENTERRFYIENQEWKKSMRGLIRKKELSSPLSEFIGVSIVLALMFYGAKLVFKGSLLPETFFAFIIAFYQVIEPAKTFNTALFNIKQGMASYDRVHEYLSINEEETNTNNITQLTFMDKISINNIDYTYPDGKKVLKNINLEIKKGEKVAIVGPSGSGKSTLIDLITGMKTIQSGTIHIDNVEIRQTSLYLWRKMFGMVEQIPFLFNNTVKYNIDLGKAIPENKIREYLTTTKSAEFTYELPKKENTMIGEKGMKLSGGQRQRITIARALATKADILILDEATSSLDTTSEKTVQKAIDQSTKNKTSIIIAHRLSTIINADKIIVLKDGNIEAAGTHKNLLELSETYKKMIQLQDIKD